jgi:CheY-like chemotaxis protein
VDLVDLPLRQQKLLVGRNTAKLLKPVGCPDCRGTGYKGRTIVAEVFLVTPMIQRAIARRADLAELSDLTKQCGTISMWESGLERVLDGTTSLHELLDNVPAPIEEQEQGDSAQTDIDALLAQLLAKPTDHPAPERPALPRIDDVELPANAAYDEAVDNAFSPGRGAVQNRTSFAGTPSRPPARAHGAPLRVLVVDEDRVHRRTLADAFARQGLAVIEAADGESALSYAQRLHPDIIVTEIALPRLDAIGLLQGLAGAGMHTRVIVYTRQNDPDMHLWLRELGAEDIVLTSVDPKALAVRLRGKVVSLA